MKSYSLIIDRIEDETADAYTLHFRTDEPALKSYKPGQYLTLKVKVDGQELRRAFSLSSSPATDDLLAITIKRVEGGIVSNYIRDTWKAGENVQILPPMGKFVAEINPENKKHYVLIGAGSGITPLMSILKTVLVAEKNSKVSLWYGNKSEESIIFQAQLQALQTRFAGRLEVVHVLSRASQDWQGETGRLDEAKITGLVSDLFMKGEELHKVYYTCGPNEMMDAVEKVMKTQGVNSNDVYREYYSAPTPSDEEIEAQYAEPSEEEVYQDYNATIILDGQSHQITVKAGQYILDAAIDAGIDPPYACQSGICTTCRGMLHAGTVQMDETEGLSDQELHEGFVLTCQSHCMSEGVEVEFK